MCDTETLLNALTQIKEELVKNRTNCYECGFFDRDKEVCIKYRARPPIRIIVYGCDEFCDIPF